MVYCNFVKAEDDRVIYAFGGTSKDLTGELVIMSSNPLSFRVIKEPENSKVSQRHIEYMIGRHLQELKRKKYPLKMAYEI